MLWLCIDAGSGGFRVRASVSSIISYLAVRIFYKMASIDTRVLYLTRSNFIVFIWIFDPS